MTHKERHVYHSFEEAFGNHKEVEEIKHDNKRKTNVDEQKNKKEAMSGLLKRLNGTQLQYFSSCNIDHIKRKLSKNKQWYFFGDNEISREDLSMVLKWRTEAPELFSAEVREARNSITKAEKRKDKAKKQKDKTNYKSKAERYNQTHPKRVVLKGEPLHKPEQKQIIDEIRLVQEGSDIINLYCMRYHNMSNREVRNELFKFIEAHDINTIRSLEVLSKDGLEKRMFAGKSGIKGVSLADLGLFLTIKKRGITGKPSSVKERFEANKKQLSQVKESVPQYTSVPLEQSEGIAFEDFVVKGNNLRCIFNHESVLIKAAISLLTRDGRIIQKTIPAGFCPKCKSFYILKRDFDDISDYGVPLCQQFTEDEFRIYVRGWTQELKEHSIINQMGYNVNAKKDLSTTQRRSILALALDNNIYTRAQLDNHLYTQIALRVKTPNMENAIEKWEEDRKFIQNYKAGSIKIVGVKSITNKLINK